MTSSNIHPTAVIGTGAIIGEGTTVGPYSVIGEHVVIGKSNNIHSHVVIDGHTSVGDGNTIFQFASVGAVPQDLKYKGEASTLLIGDSNIIREYVTLQPGTAAGGMKTVIGNKNLFMACVHVGHDGIIGDGNIFANGAALAGHITVGNRATVGGLSGLHQFVRVGDFSMIGAGSMVTKDIPPFCNAQGDRAGLVGINAIGLERAKFAAEDILLVKEFYKEFFLRQGGTVKEKAEQVLKQYPESGVAKMWGTFIIGTDRGITLPRRKAAASAVEE